MLRAQPAESVQLGGDAGRDGAMAFDRGMYPVEQRALQRREIAFGLEHRDLEGTTDFADPLVHLVAQERALLHRLRDQEDPRATRTRTFDQDRELSAESLEAHADDLALH